MIDAAKSLALFEAKMESADRPSLRDYIRELGELNESLSTLEAVLWTQGTPDSRALNTVRVRYAQAERLWTACESDHEVFEGELVRLNSLSTATLLAKKVLADFPRLDQQFADGGALSPNKNYVSCRRLLRAIWADAKTQGHHLRSELRVSARSCSRR
ncbi:hypothetical protein GCM10027034_28520 [Ramlibacter solisilvae]